MLRRNRKRIIFYTIIIQYNTRLVRIILLLYRYLDRENVCLIFHVCRVP